MTALALFVVWSLGWLAGRAVYPSQLAFVGLGSLLWTYHLGYDFVCLLPALLTLLAAQAGTPLLCWRTIGAFMLMLVLGTACFAPKGQAGPGLEWGTQVILFGWYGAMAFGVLRVPR